uniref:NYN domain-containing protein n=1 Tax=Chromera velia CCMP2878 TaxID=1169474 RepID=A0A0G4GR26_9ALVE|eukprot:Cvel_22957.t1-p1 / transcript=Cvel_22957.t1 / gene=Cvel_22957 / organism=Chromera_velia_CCMP2878 / gene_product=hypothetical protein / transcript_product=hypothetical protein / location=Cvel_scaffold2312:28843-29838(-) / protein_length=332 / sequence_SO=supercontig / SO=protein_coding / is_pseudo=false
MPTIDLEDESEGQGVVVIIDGHNLYANLENVFGLLDADDLVDIVLPALLRKLGSERRGRQTRLYGRGRVGGQNPPLAPASLVVFSQPSPGEPAASPPAIATVYGLGHPMAGAPIPLDLQAAQLAAFAASSPVPTGSPVPASSPSSSGSASAEQTKPPEMRVEGIVWVDTQVEYEDDEITQQFFGPTQKTHEHQKRKEFLKRLQSRGVVCEFCDTDIVYTNDGGVIDRGQIQADVDTVIAEVLFEKMAACTPSANNILLVSGDGDFSATLSTIGHELDAPCFIYVAAPDRRTLGEDVSHASQKNIGGLWAITYINELPEVAELKRRYLASGEY